MKKYLLILVCLLTLQSTGFAVILSKKGDLKALEVLKPIESEETGKPTFISVTVDVITPYPGTKFYNLDLTVVCSGADYLYVEQHEEFSDIVDTHFFEVSDMIQLHFENIYMIGRAWVVLELNNKAGKTYYTVEIPSQMPPSQISEVTANSSISHIEVRDVQGMIVLRTENYEDINRLAKGIYIVTITYTDGKRITKKICQ